MADGVKHHALSSQHDFYDLLGVQSTASESEIRRAWRKTALKYHPDKAGASNTEAFEKFHLLQIALDVLVDETARQLYDNARRAREEKKARDGKLEGKRRAMKEDLERRESGFLKRKHDELEEEEAFQRELRRLAEDGKRRRKEREEALRAEAMLETQVDETANKCNSTDSNGDKQQSYKETSEVDRSITLRFIKNDSTQHMDAEYIKQTFGRKFGPIEDVLLRDKKFRIDGEKHRRLYTTAVIAFKSIVGAHACVSDLSELAHLTYANEEDWGFFKEINWASGKPPDCVPIATPKTLHATPLNNPLDVLTTDPPSQPQTPAKGITTGAGGLRKVPSFASFKGTPKSTSPIPNYATPSKDDTMMMRLREAQKRKIAEQRSQDQTPT
ncbi:DnaJ-domain-containing protein [Polychaeton citri CBS 116435]|uniref:DnaJ-domain-containing protein n=1 Tax=Polychaeton citri CBS 116435 TaxID=1314669 RepID=A0A9P4Q4L4_9PEZI|nr:DnaJ-domain-containing protein [Polychaeton citri CBS 116435]